MSKTLTDFILCNVSELEVHQFNKVLSKNIVTGAPSKPDELAKLLTDYYESRNSGIWNKIFGPGTDPFDMEPEELERLTKVFRDPKAQVEFEVPLETYTPSEMSIAKKRVNQFILRNGVFFDKMKDVYIDETKKVLKYQGRIELAQELLKILGYKPDEIKKLIKPRRNANEHIKVAVPLEHLGVEYSRSFIQLYDKFKRDMEQAEVKFDMLIEKQKASDNLYYLIFEGNWGVLEKFLSGKNYLNLDEKVIKSIRTRVEEYGETLRELRKHQEEHIKKQQKQKK